MVDLVGTCPKDFWNEWIAEGDAAGDPYTGEEWGWFTKDRTAQLIKPGDRFYIVAHGRLRGWAPVTRVSYAPPAWSNPTADRLNMIGRRGDAVACTIPEEIKGFRGLRERWWPRQIEIPFPDWKTAGVIIGKSAKVKPIAAAPLFGAR